ncbi:MAG: hypothetical protein P1V81_01965 [Planctomycetota bacterium]|nr:hypothetical protein [Planctomycetota bacterium]
MLVPRRPRPRVGHADRSGYAVLAVLLVLMALLMLVTPFLATVRNADKTSQRRADLVEANLGLDNAARLARARLGASHQGVDATPLADSAEELDVRNDLAADFAGPAGQDGGARWDLEVQDLAGRVDLDSAPPHMLANLLGFSTRLVKPLGVGDKEIAVASTDRFPESGVLWVAGELIQYKEIKDGAFQQLQRGLGAQYEDDKPVAGPLPARNAVAGATVHDQRAWALAKWRLVGIEPDAHGLYEPRQLGSSDRLAQVADFVLDGDWDLDLLQPLVAEGSAWAEYGAGPRWLAPTRITRPIISGETNEIQVEDTRWFNPGTTVRIHGGGASELALVRAVNSRTGLLYLDRPLFVEHSAYRAVAEPMARRAVNVNTASPAVLEALFVNLQLAGRNSRITRDEARTLVEVIVESRPFLGFDDFLERVVLPAAGFEPLPADSPVVPEAFVSDDAESLGGFLDEDDAIALYRNALNANDTELSYSTMPLRFTSQDVYRLDLRVSVTASAGVQRLERRREEVQQIAPGGELLRLWSNQADFDEELRLSRSGKLWNTGPEPTSRPDGFLGSSPPPRAPAHLGAFAFRPDASGVRPAIERVAPSSEEGFARLMPSRQADEAPYAGRLFHFDWEPEDNEGRDLAERPMALQVDDPRVGWATGSRELARPMTFSAWIKPRTTNTGYYLDLGGNYFDTDRVSLFVDGTDLVLRVLDGAGDHPATVFEEVAEVRHSLAEPPGLPPDVWTHVLVDVRGNRPDQMLLMVDARPATDTPGLTRLATSMSSSDNTILVESTEGFPDPCVLRIGEELIEARVVNSTTFEATHMDVGEDAGFGGRIARERFSAPGGNLPMINGGLGKTINYGAGTPVGLYGYSVPLTSNVSSTVGTLGGDLGPFAVARAVGAVGGQSPQGDAVVWDPLAIPGTLNLGLGMEGDSSNVTAIVLEPADAGRDVSEVMSAFSPVGGYAAIVQLANGTRIGTEDVETTFEGTPIFQMEIVHYSGWQGNELQIDKRGDACTELQLPAGPTFNFLDRHAFVFNWYPNWTVANGGEQIMNLLNWQTFVVPISIPVNGAAAGIGFPTPVTGSSEFAQLTRIASETQLTEWVRYDEVVNDQLVRSSPTALNVLSNVLLGGVTGEDVQEPPPETGESVAPAGAGIFEMVLSPAPPEPSMPTVAAAPAATQPAAIGPYWDETMGFEEYGDWALSAAVQSQFQFRGVMGTYHHKHSQGTPVMPVFRVRDSGPDAGWPGRHDQAFLMDYSRTSPGWPVTVHRSYRPLQYVATGWERAPDSEEQPLEAIPSGPPIVLAEANFATGDIFVALNGPAPIPISPGVQTQISGQTVYDIRETARLVMFPSGELPREIDRVFVGDSIETPTTTRARIDEAGFLSSPFGLSTGAGEPALGGSLYLRQELGSGSTTIFVQPASLRHAGGNISSSTPLLDELPDDAGLLRIGSEIVCYQSYDSQAGTLSVANNGRGLLGTREQDHATGESVTFLEAFTVTLLSGPIDADESSIDLVDAGGFPGEGTVLIDEELIHFTRRVGSRLEMPERSETPGARAENGGGLFRGRYGTTPSGHSGGAIVILFPFRYWDRWSDGADAPELSYFGFSPQQEDAFWQRLFWSTSGEVDGATIGCLVRTDPTVPWDSDPATTKGLYEFTSGRIESEGNPLNFQSDRVEVRLFTRYQPGAYDAVEGLSHGWKIAPRLELFGFEFLAPSSVLTRVWR